PNGINYQPGVLVPEVLSQESPAAQAGIRVGDIILAVDGEPLSASETAVTTLMTTIKSSPNEPIDLTVQRGDRQLDLTVTPIPDSSGTPRIGVQLQPNGKLQFRRPNGIFEVFSLAADMFQNMFMRTVQGFVMLVTNFSQVASQVAGPVKIVEQGAGLVTSDPFSLFPYTAIISINLAIINILPLPALDGGQLIFLLIEALRGKPLPDRLQENVMQTGLVLLLGLGIFLIVRDTAQLEIFHR
ncbi:MAG: RIP metalloprotease RseP, partial [Oculatellaceae cyanobacterium bins.114]|nr:RIP metalloprotease RseP [Oculatellaceae cyanobacterium bins.114]